MFRWLIGSSLEFRVVVLGRVAVCSTIIAVTGSGRDAQGQREEQGKQTRAGQHGGDFRNIENAWQLKKAALFPQSVHTRTHARLAVTAH